jgi:hypothetical protein
MRTIAKEQSPAGASASMVVTVRDDTARLKVLPSKQSAFDDDRSSAVVTDATSTRIERQARLAYVATT